MKQLILIRHSKVQVEPSQASETWQVSDEGIIRSQAVAQKLKAYNIECLISSPHDKAIQTAKAISEELGIDYRIQDGLEEHHRTSESFQDSRDAFLTVIKRLFEHPNVLIYGDESANTALARFQSAVDTCLADNQDISLGLVTHGTVLALFVAKFNDVEVFDFWQSLQMPIAIIMSLPDFRLQGIIQAVE
jgi:broad specificity phosphatase PhoE